MFCSCRISTDNSVARSLYHSGASCIICMHASAIAETLLKIVSVVVEIFGEIRRFLPYRFKCTNFSHVILWRYWTKVHNIHDVEGSLRYSPAYPYCDIQLCFKMSGCLMKAIVEINCRFWTTSASGHVTAAILFSGGRFL